MFPRINFKTLMREAREAAASNTASNAANTNNATNVGDANEVSNVTSALHKALNIVNTNTHGALSGLVSDLGAHSAGEKLTISGVIKPRDIYHKYLNKYATNVKEIIFKDCEVLAESPDEQYYINSKFTPNNLTKISFINFHSSTNDVSAHIMRTLAHPAVQANVKSITIKGVDVAGNGQEIMGLLNNFNLDDADITANIGMEDLSFGLNDNSTNQDNAASQDNALENATTTTEFKVVDKKTTVSNEPENEFVNEILELIKSPNASENMDYVINLIQSGILPQQDIDRVYVAALNNPSLTNLVTDLIKTFLAPVEAPASDNIITTAQLPATTFNNTVADSEQVEIIKNLLQVPDVETIFIAKDIITTNSLNFHEYADLSKFCHNLRLEYNEPELSAIGEVQDVINKFFADQLNYS